LAPAGDLVDAVLLHGVEQAEVDREARPPARLVRAGVPRGEAGDAALVRGRVQAEAARGAVRCSFSICAWSCTVESQNWSSDAMSFSVPVVDMQKTSLHSFPWCHGQFESEIWTPD
jgi:hypothetical protein